MHVHVSLHFSYLLSYLGYIFRFLNVLRLLVQNYSISEKAFLPNILNFSLKQVYPIIVNVSQAYYNY